jgi:CheY-like chemotaxis protein
MMNICNCSVCGYSVDARVWGFAVLARDGWAITPTTNPPGAAERGWLCAECAAHSARARDAVAKQIGPKSAPSRAGAARPLHVLVVDDHVLLLRCVARLLSGYETVLTTNPRHALELLLAGGEFDVIVCDVMMPEVTGPQLYERCFAHSPELAQRFLFMSSDPIAARRAIDEVAARIRAAQVPPLLRKPIAQATLLAAVSAIGRAASHPSGTYLLRLPGQLESEPEARSAIDKPVRGSSSGTR